MKKKSLILLLASICLFLTFVIGIKNVKEVKVESKDIQTREIVGEKEDTQFILMDKFSGGGGGLVNSNMGGFIGGFGTIAIGGIGFSNFFSNFFPSQNNNSNSTSILNNNNTQVQSSITIDDVLSNKEVSDGMNKYGWSKNDITNWLEIMIDVSISKFLDDKDLVIYLGRDEYYKKRNIDNHEYVFHTSDDEWNRLLDFCDRDFDKVWVLNMAFLQMCIMKDAKFFLVTATKYYYDYSFGVPRSTFNGKPSFYGRELEYINKNGYNWYEYETAPVETTKSMLKA